MSERIETGSMLAESGRDAGRVFSPTDPDAALVGFLAGPGDQLHNDTRPGADGGGRLEWRRTQVGSEAQWRAAHHHPVSSPASRCGGRVGQALRTTLSGRTNMSAPILLPLIESYTS